MLHKFVLTEYDDTTNEIAVVVYDDETKETNIACPDKDITRRLDKAMHAVRVFWHYKDRDPSQAGTDQYDEVKEKAVDSIINMNTMFANIHNDVFKEKLIWAPTKTKESVSTSQ
jgi:hypothetical protein